MTQTLAVQMESMVQSDLEEASPRRLWVLSGDTAFPRVTGVKDTLNYVCWVNWIQRHKEGRKKKFFSKDGKTTVLAHNSG